MTADRLLQRQTCQNTQICFQCIKITEIIPLAFKAGMHDGEQNCFKYGSEYCKDNSLFLV